MEGKRLRMMKWFEFVLLAVVCFTQTYGCAQGRSIRQELAPAVTQDFIRIESYPFLDASGVTSVRNESYRDYSCVQDEGGPDYSGPQTVYRVHVEQTGVLTAKVKVTQGDEFRVHLFLLQDDNPSQCLTHARREFTHWVDPGTYRIIVEGTTSDLEETTGQYAIKVGFLKAQRGDCTVNQQTIELKWGQQQLPATGPVVREAHLVTAEQSFSEEGWPQGYRDGVSEHIRKSSERTGFIATRRDGWCPEGEGGCHWGEGSSIRPPIAHEAWYICLYWKTQPPPGSRMIVTNPANGRSVVAIAGYETGPGHAHGIAGVVEEVHTVLGSDHRDELTFGFARDQTLAPGPIDCVGMEDSQ